MTVSIAQFRQDYTEFSDTTVYPDSDVQYHLTLAGKLLNADRWTTLLDTGTELFIAHNLALEAPAKAAAANGAPPGETTGPVSSKSVDKVSVSYDTQAAIELDAGHWNMTIYGTRFIRLARMMGAGPIQVGASCGSDPLSSANAWPGPYTGPGWFG